MEGRKINVNHKSFTLGNPQVLALEIGPNNDRQLLKVVIKAYQALNDSKIVKEDWPEDKITRELYVQIHIFVIKNGINTIPFHQYPIYLKKRKRGRPPTIDFVFRKGYIESPYLGFECKIVDERKSDSIRAYINDGMFRFISAKYAKNQRVGGMVAYILNFEVIRCVNKINERIQNHNKLGKEDCLILYDIIDDFKDLYISKHKRENLRNLFLLYHVFMFFDN